MDLKALQRASFGSWLNEFYLWILSWWSSVPVSTTMIESWQDYYTQSIFNMVPCSTKHFSFLAAEVFFPSPQHGIHKKVRGGWSFGVRFSTAWGTSESVNGHPDTTIQVLPELEIISYLLFDIVWCCLMFICSLMCHLDFHGCFFWPKSILLTPIAARKPF